MPDRSVRGPDLERDHEGQPAPAVVRLHGLRADVRPAPDRASPHAVCGSDLRHDPAEAAQGRSLGPRLGAAGQSCHGGPPPPAGRGGGRPPPPTPPPPPRAAPTPPP